MNYKQEMILKMKLVQFKIAFIVFATFSFSLFSQNDRKNYKEEFKVNSDVVIDVNTRHTDIEIITWNKNEVVVEAFMKVDGDKVDDKMRDEYYDKWEFEAYGNSSKIHVKSRSNSFIDINSFDFDAPNYDIFYKNSGNQNGFTFVMPDISIQGLDILDSIDFVMPEIPEIPEIPELPEINIVIPDLPPMPSKFDYDQYKKDKSYLERWKKENEDLIGKNADVTVNRNSISIKSKKGKGKSYYNWSFSNDDEERAEEIAERVEKALERSREALERSKEAREKRMKELEKRHEERKKLHEERKKEMKQQQVQRDEQRKLALVKRQEAREKQRKEIQTFLKNRDDIKIKRHIVIRAPKDAKFNMNVRYGSMSFPNK